MCIEKMSSITTNSLDNNYVLTQADKFRAIISIHSNTTRSEDKTIQNASKKVAGALGFTGVEQKAAMTDDLLETIKFNILNSLGDSNTNSGNNEEYCIALKTNKIREKLKILDKYLNALKNYTPHIQNVIINAIVEWCPKLDIDDINSKNDPFVYPEEILHRFFLYNKHNLKYIDILKLSIKNPFIFQYYCHQKLECLNEANVSTILESLIPLKKVVEQEDSLSFYLAHPYLNRYFMHEAFSLYILSGSSIFLKLVRLTKERITKVIVDNDENNKKVLNWYFPKSLISI